MPNNLWQEMDDPRQATFDPGPARAPNAVRGEGGNAHGVVEGEFSDAHEKVDGM
jgi:hypothetical protein